MRLASLLLSIWLACVSTVAIAQDVTAFYKNKLLRVVSPFAVEGTYYTALAQLMADYLPRYLPGTPKSHVEFVPGGGGMQGANFMYAAPGDGTIVGLLYDGMPTVQALHIENLVRFDARRYSVLGSFNKGETGLLGMFDRSGVKTLADARAKKAVLGAIGTSSAQYVVPTAINQLIGTKFQIIPGFKSVNDIFLAMDNGEVDGIFTNFNTIAELRPNWITDKRFHWLAQGGEERDPAFANVPLLQELVDAPLDKRIFSFLALSRIAGKMVIAPPQVPYDRLAALRDAFAKMLRDPEVPPMLAHIRLMVEARNGDDTLEIIRQTVDAPPEVLDYVRKVMQPK